MGMRTAPETNASAPGWSITYGAQNPQVGGVNMDKAGLGFSLTTGNPFISDVNGASVTFSGGGLATGSAGLLSLGNVATLAAAGADQAGAAAIVAQVTFVTAADGTKGVRLPAVTAGAMYIVYSTVATNGLKVYPASGDDINDATGDAAITIEGKTMAIFIGMDTSTWGAIYTVNT